MSFLLYIQTYETVWGFPGDSDRKESARNAGDLASIPGSGRCPGEGNGNPLQYSCLENPMDRGAWWATVHGVTRVGHNLATKPPPLEISSPGGSDGKESARNAGDLALITNLGGSPGEENGNPLQYSCLENPHGQRSLVGCSPWGCKELDTTDQLSTAQLL